MAKKKSRKKENSKKKSEKKKSEKKKLLKLKLKKKAAKKEAKKKEGKKKEAKKKLIIKEEPKIKKVKDISVPKVAVKQPKDHSSNYNVKDALAKLRALKTKAELIAFIKGEKRVSITKVIPAALNKLEA